MSTSVHLSPFHAEIKNRKESVIDAEVTSVRFVNMEVKNKGNMPVPHFQAIWTLRNPKGTQRVAKGELHIVEVMSSGTTEVKVRRSSLVFFLFFLIDSQNRLALLADKEQKKVQATPAYVDTIVPLKPPAPEGPLPKPRLMAPVMTLENEKLFPPLELKAILCKAEMRETKEWNGFQNEFIQRYWQLSPVHTRICRAISHFFSRRNNNATW
jgi:hypothetical protein